MTSEQMEALRQVILADGYTENTKYKDDFGEYVLYYCENSKQVQSFIAMNPKDGHVRCIVFQYLFTDAKEEGSFIITPSEIIRRIADTPTADRNAWQLSFFTRFIPSFWKTAEEDKGV